MNFQKHILFYLSSCFWPPPSHCLISSQILSIAICITEDLNWQYNLIISTLFKNLMLKLTNSYQVCWFLSIHVHWKLSAGVYGRLSRGSSLFKSPFPCLPLAYTSPTMKIKLMHTTFTLYFNHYNLFIKNPEYLVNAIKSCKPD